MDKDLKKALKQVFKDKSPSDLQRWTGLSLKRCIKICTMLLTDVFLEEKIYGGARELPYQDEEDY